MVRVSGPIGRPEATPVTCRVLCQRVKVYGEFIINHPSSVAKAPAFNIYVWSIDIIIVCRFNLPENRRKLYLAHLLTQA